MGKYTEDYLLNKKVKILQPQDGYRASSDAVLLAALPSQIKPGESVLDVGSGTGAVSLCLSYRFPNNKIIGLELQPFLAELSNLSASINHYFNLSYFQGDIKNKNLPVQPCSFHHVVTNPPYSCHDMPSPNLSKALAHNHQNQDFNDWLKFCLKMLKPFGRLYMIHRVESLQEILSFLHGKAGDIQIIPVYSKSGQNAKRVLIAAQKDSKAPTKILPPLYIRTLANEYTDAANLILREGQTYSDINKTLA